MNPDYHGYCLPKRPWVPPYWDGNDLRPLPKPSSYRRSTEANEPARPAKELTVAQLKKLRDKALLDSDSFDRILEFAEAHPKAFELMKELCK